MKKLQTIYETHFGDYLMFQKIDLEYYFKKVKKIELNSESFVFYNSVSAMSSSKIEGEQMDIDSYVKYKTTKTKYVESLVQKPNDLYIAYEFAQKNKLTKNNLLKAHKIISKHLLHSNFRGKVRDSDMVIKDGKNWENCL